MNYSLINYLTNNFENISKTRLICIVMFGCLLIALIVLLGLVFVHTTNIDKYKKNVSSGNNNVRIYSLHYNENKIYVIDKHNLKEKKSHDINWIYESVTDKDKLRLKVWLTELQKEEHKVPHHIEIHVFLKKTKAEIFSVLEVNSINYEKGIIHLESHLFPNINKIKKDKNTKIFIKNEESMPSIISQNIKSFVSVYNIRLFSTYEFDSNVKFRADHLIITQIENRLVKYLSSNRYLTLLKSNEIVLTDFSVLNTNGAIALGHNFAKEVSKILFLNALQNQFSFKIGVVMDKTHTKTFQELSKTAKEMSIFAEDNDIQSPVILYDSALNYQQLSQNTIVDSIKQLIKNKEMVRRYVPIFEGDDSSKIFGYHVELIPKKSLLSSFTEIQEYSYNNNISSSLLSMVLDDILLPTNENVLANYVINIQLPFYKDIIDLAKGERYSEELKQIVFIFDDKDILSFSQEGSNPVMIFKELKDNNANIGINFTSSILEIGNELLLLADYFVIDDKNFSDLLSSSKHQILFQDLVSKLLTYHKKLLVINVSSWTSLEYHVKNDIELLSSDLLGYAFNEEPEIDKKKFDKAKEIYLNHHKKN